MDKKLIWQCTIPLTPITKKNHMQIVTNPKTHIPFLIPSKAYREYEAEACKVIQRPAEPISQAVEVKAVFYMPTRRKCDLTNHLESIDDVLVKAGVLADDNYEVIYSHDGSRVFYDKENPRTEVAIYERRDDEKN